MLFLDVSWVNFIVGIVGMVKETIEVFFRLGPLHVIVVYETKPGNWIVGCRLYD
jgi:hypothetical protein